MATKVLEGVKSKVEGATITPVAEVKEPTEPEVKPTVIIEETEEFRHALDKALGKGLESTNRQLSTAQQEAKMAKAEADATKAAVKAYEESIAELEKRLEQHYDPEELKAYRLEIREKKAALKEASVEVEKTRLEQERAEHKAEREGWLLATEMDAYRKELQKIYRAPTNLLEKARSKVEMEEIAKEFPEISKEPPKLDSAISSGGTLRDKEFIEEMASKGSSYTKEEITRLKSLGIG